MPTNDFLPFGSAEGANVMSQADYAALTARLNGFAAGTAKSEQLNKAWRQSSIMGAVLAQFISDQSGQDSIDDGTTATLEVNLVRAIRAAISQTIIPADIGVTNAYAAENSPPLAVLPATGYIQRLSITHPNTGASTYAPDGLAAKPVYGLGLQPLQGGELPVGIVVLMYSTQANVNGGNGAWILIDSLGGAAQVAPATRSQHAMQLGQAVGRLLNIQVITASGTYTKTSGTNKIKVRGCGGGGAGGGTQATGAGQAAAGGGGSAGGIGEGFYDATGFVTQSVVVGTAGVGAIGSVGGNGTSSTFGNLLTLPGGNGGAVGAAQASLPNDGGGSAVLSGMPVGANIWGSAGGGGNTGIVLSVASAQGGIGGASPFGASRQGNNAIGFGAGGAGQRATASNGANNGANGAPGVFIVEEYA